MDLARTRLAAVSWALAHHDLSDKSRILLAWIALHVDASMMCPLSWRKIAALAGMSERSAQYHLALLRDRGAILPTLDGVRLMIGPRGVR